jgi:hypothetical protein
MTRFEFALSTADAVRQAGVVHSDSFTNALSLVGQHITPNQGDTLEIGVRGFPPARYECVSTLIEGEPLWKPAGEMAA